MDKIPSFEKDHDAMQPGLHFSTLQNGVMTLDLRFKKPNAGDYITPKALHTIEHLLATVLRNSEKKDDIVYFGPMGCRTGFYLLTLRLSFEEVLVLLQESIKKALTREAGPGSKREECGNYLEHDLAAAKEELTNYLLILEGVEAKP